MSNLRVGALTAIDLRYNGIAPLRAYYNGETVFASPLGQLLTALESGAAQLIAHPLEYGMMYQDRAGTIPVTESGQLLGYCDNGGIGDYPAIAVSDAARMIFRDVDGVRGLEYNGVNGAYQTPVLPAPGVDKAQVFAGVRKLNNGGGEIVDTGYPSGSGRFFVRNGGTSGAAPRYSAAGRGSAEPAGAFVAEAPSIYAAPSTNIITAEFDISAPFTRLRIDGAQQAQVTVSTGAGNLNPAGDMRLYYGARTGTSLFFNGFHYATLGPITRFSSADASPEQIEAAEAYFTARIPA